LRIVNIIVEFGKMICIYFLFFLSSLEVAM
jgi:hypothetical protein